MPLLSGTALQNGHYVIDALLEEASNGNVYWGTHVPTGLAVYLQELVTGETGLSPELATCLQGLAFAPQPPLPNPLQLLQEGDRYYLAMGTGLGRPWCYGYRHYSPVAPKAALALTQRTGKAIQTLLRQGLPTVDMSPNRLWVTAGSAPVILTGLTVPPETSDLPFAHPLKGLAALLYSLLTGSLPTVTDLPQIGEALSQQCPNLSPLILQGIQQGLGELEPVVTTATASSLADYIHQWLQTLPDGPLPQMSAPIQGALPTSATAPAQAEAVTVQATMAPTATEPAIPTPDPAVTAGSPRMEPEPERVPEPMAPEVLTPEPMAPVGIEPGPGGVLVSQGDSAGDRGGALVPVVVPYRRPRRRLLPALGLTAVVAAMGGGAVGAAWRFNLTELSEQVRLNPEQTFPAQGDWQGDPMTTEFENPFFSEGEGVRSPFPESLPDSSSFNLDLERSIAPREPWGDVEPDRWEPLPVEPEVEPELEQRPTPVAPPPVTPPPSESPAPINPVVPENPSNPRPPAAPAPERDTTPEMPAREES